MKQFLLFLMICSCTLPLCAQTIQSNLVKDQDAQKYYYLDGISLSMDLEVRPGRKEYDSLDFPLYILLRNNTAEKLKKNTDTITATVNINGHNDTIDLTLDEDLDPDSATILHMPFHIARDLLNNSLIINVKQINGMDENNLCSKIIRLNGDSVSDNWCCSRFDAYLFDRYAYDSYVVSPSKDTLYFFAENTYDIHLIPYAIIVGPNSKIPGKTPGIWSGYQKPVGNLIIPRLVYYYSLYYLSEMLPVTKIEGSAFYDCDSIISIDMPNTIEYVGDVFKGCTRLEAITIRAKNPPKTNSGTFSGVDSNITLTVPCSAITAYQSAANWSRFHNIKGFFEYKLTAVPGNASLGTVEILQKPLCENPQAVIQAFPNEGQRFSRWNDENRDNPRTVTVTSDTVFKAIFLPVGVEETEEVLHSIFSEPGKIVISGLKQQEIIEVYNVMGQIHFRGVAQDAVVIPVSSCGIYFVRIGNNAVRKIAVTMP